LKLAERAGGTLEVKDGTKHGDQKEEQESNKKQSDKESESVKLAPKKRPGAR
jgi:hypothetical protein